MTYKYPTAVGLALFVCWGGQITSATAPQQTAAAAGPTVDVLVTVTDKSGKAVRGLTRTAFKIFESGKPQIVTEVADASNSPLSVVIVLDRSGSAKDGAPEFGSLLDASMRLLEPMFQARQAKAALVTTFDSQVQLRQDFTDDPATLRSAINSAMADARGGTSLYDALTSVASSLLNIPGRRLVIAIGDGADTTSHSPHEVAMRALHRSNVAVISAYTGRRNPVSGIETLKKTSAETGGRFFDYAEGKKFEALREELGSQYNLRYQTTNAKADGKFRGIRVEASNKDYKIRYRTGYYAPQ